MKPKIVKKRIEVVPQEDAGLLPGTGDDVLVVKEHLSLEELDILASSMFKKLQRAMLKRDDIDVDIRTFREGLDMLNARILNAGGVPVGIE